MHSPKSKDLEYWSWLLQTRRERLVKFQDLDAPELLINLEETLVKEAESEVKARQGVTP